MESLAMEIRHDYQTEPLSQQPKRSPRTDNAPTLSLTVFGGLVTP